MEIYFLVETRHRLAKVSIPHDHYFYNDSWLRTSKEAEKFTKTTTADILYRLVTVKGEVQQIPTPIMFLDNLNKNIKSWRNPKFNVKIYFLRQ